jgi:hypothetical protein
LSFTSTKKSPDTRGRSEAGDAYEPENRKQKSKPNKGEHDSIEAAALDDLKRSGLDRKDYKLLRIEPLTAKEVEKEFKMERDGYRIPYFDLRGKQIQYSRVRLLKVPKRKGFTGKKHANKYTQPENSVPHLYLPPYRPWHDIAKDPDQRIIITEGEKKAALACKKGLNCIALGGVYGYKAKKRLWDVIPELSQISWNGREVEVCYDSDVARKSEVRDAMHGLASVLTNEFAPKEISFVHLTSENSGDKAGMDDYILANGIKSFMELDREPFRPTALLHQLNEKICFVNKIGKFYSIEHDTEYSGFWQLKDAYATAGMITSSEGKPVPAVEHWYHWPNRRQVRALTYLPGGPLITEDGDLNTWKPSLLEPRKGTPKLWLKLVDHVIGGGRDSEGNVRHPEYVEWFLKWLAYPLQSPGTKLYQACFIYSKKHGTGKTFLVDPVMQHIYGKDNFKKFKSGNIGGKFNSFDGHTQFAAFDEVYLSSLRDRRELMGELKDVVTRMRVTVNRKFRSEIELVDYCNYYLTSNYADALPIEPDDRRFFVIEAPNERLSPEFFKELDTYFRQKGGAAEVLHYLLNNVDTSDFQPQGDALWTKYKDEVIGLSKSQFEEFIDRLKRDPLSLLKTRNGTTPSLELMRAEDVLKLFLHHHQEGRWSYITEKKVAHALDKAGFPFKKAQVAAGSPKYSLYAILNPEYWVEQKKVKWARHYKENKEV